MLWALLLLFFDQASPATMNAPELVSVCDILRSRDLYNNKVVFLLGRVAKRPNGRWIGEDSCESKLAGELPQPVAIRFDPASGPKPTEPFELNAAEAAKKFQTISKHSVVHEFRFGSGEYEMWGIVYGKVEDEKGALAIVCRGESMVFTWSGTVR